MRAVWVRQLGPPTVLVAGDAPDPLPGPGQVVVAVEYAGVTYIETQMRAGTSPMPAFGGVLPAIPGNATGGTVAALGPDVDPSLAGVRVLSATGGTGGYAERVAVPAAGLIRIPDPLDTDAATALLADGRTAMALLRAAAPQPGERVLVEAAAGALGSLLVQLAAAAGATVVAAASGARKLALARELGATETVDYSEPDWTAAVRERGGVDVVLDGVGGAIGRAGFDLLGPGGRMFAFGLASGRWSDIPAALAAERGVVVTRGPQVDPQQSGELTTAALTAAAAGRLRPVIGQRVPLAQAAAAHAAIEARHTVGKTLLVI